MSITGYSQEKRSLKKTSYKHWNFYPSYWVHVNPSFDFAAYGERLDCLFLGKDHNPQEPTDSIILNSDRKMRVIDLLSGMTRVFPLQIRFYHKRLKNKGDSGNNENKTAGIGSGGNGTYGQEPDLRMADLLAPLPKLDSRNLTQSEDFYKKLSRSIDVKKKMEEKKLKKFVTDLKKEWQHLTRQNKALEKRVGLYHALRKRGETLFVFLFSSFDKRTRDS